MFEATVAENSTIARLDVPSVNSDNSSASGFGFLQKLSNYVSDKINKKKKLELIEIKSV